MLLNQW